MGFAVIFDMDGVLVDSTKYIWKSFNTILRPYNIHFKDKDIKEYLGHSLRDQLKIWKEKFGVSFELEEFSRKSGDLQFQLIGKAKINKQLLRLLQELKLKKIPMGVGTSSLRWRAEKILGLLKISDYFSALVTAEDVVEHKPSPQLFLKVAESLNVLPKDCVVIEDASSGIEAAKNAGMKAIGYSTDYTSKTDLQKADLIVENFSELSYPKISKLFS